MSSRHVFTCFTVHVPLHKCDNTLSFQAQSLIGGAQNLVQHTKVLAICYHDPLCSSQGHEASCHHDIIIDVIIIVVVVIVIVPVGLFHCCHYCYHC